MLPFMLSSSYIISSECSVSNQWHVYQPSHCFVCRRVMSRQAKYTLSCIYLYTQSPDAVDQAGLVWANGCGEYSRLDLLYYTILVRGYCNICLLMLLQIAILMGPLSYADVVSYSLSRHLYMSGIYHQEY